MAVFGVIPSRIYNVVDTPQDHLHFVRLRSCGTLQIESLAVRDQVPNCGRMGKPPPLELIAAIHFALGHKLLFRAKKPSQWTDAEREINATLIAEYLALANWQFERGPTAYAGGYNPPIPPIPPAPAKE